jgi:NAD(P)-dependent dehydrogenase (short-subunit alcohol dehydrogenase family)
VSGSDLNGKSAIVTGASRGIGLAIARALIDAGARVTITARDAAGLDSAASALGSDRVQTVTGNTADPGHRAETVDRTLQRFGAIDILVNNTGINPHYGPLIEIEAEAMRKILDTNVVATLGWIQQVHREWMADQGGAVVNVGSVAGVRPAAKIGGYAASKAAVVHMTRQLAAELGPRVRVNAVAPAVVRTRFAAKLFADEESVAARYPLCRIGEAEDVAGAVCFLASDAAGWITGQTLAVDGGLLATGGIES